jgi:hypothetical protein
MYPAVLKIPSLPLETCARVCGLVKISDGQKGKAWRDAIVGRP